jgi:cytochrome c5
MAIQAHAGGPASSTDLSTTQANGTELLEAKCNVCHGPGIAGAPKIGDKAAWAPRIVQGKATLYEHAIKGFEGSSGVMPPQGGPTGAPDALIQQAVDQMIQLSRKLQLAYVAVRSRTPPQEKYTRSPGRQS